MQLTRNTDKHKIKDMQKNGKNSILSEKDLHMLKALLIIVIFFIFPFSVHAENTDYHLIYHDIPEYGCELHYFIIFSTVQEKYCMYSSFLTGIENVSVEYVMSHFAKLSFEEACVFFPNFFEEKSYGF